jgi:hypothetical protein
MLGTKNKHDAIRCGRHDLGNAFAISACDIMAAINASAVLHNNAPDIPEFLVQERFARNSVMQSGANS